MVMELPASPPSLRAGASTRPPSPPTPEATRRVEESRLRAKALRGLREAGHNPPQAHPNPRMASNPAAIDDNRLSQSPSAKRPYSSISRDQIPATNRDARLTHLEDGAGAAAGDLRPISRKFTKYVDYNFSAMTDTKGGFLSAEDDPWNKSMSTGATDQRGSSDVEPKPAHMTAAEWERLQLIIKLQRNKAGPFEPGLSVLSDEKTRKRCRECRSVEIDFVWEEVFGCAVCNTCKERFPDKYSLLTKTECREDYLLTDPELKDPELLPHLSKPNPHKSHWHDMMLFLRYQVEEYAFGQKWGSVEALDAEFEKREADKRRRKEVKFKEKLLDLKRKTRTDAVRRNNAGSSAAGVLTKGGASRGAKFGDSIGGSGKHVHEWGRTVENGDGVTVKTCLSCGMEVEELEF